MTGIGLQQLDIPSVIILAFPLKFRCSPDRVKSTLFKLLIEVTFKFEWLQCIYLKRWY